MKITVEFWLPEAAITNGWNGRLDEVAASVAARLDEFYDDNGGVQFPRQMAVKVETLGTAGADWHRFPDRADV